MNHIRFIIYIMRDKYLKIDQQDLDYMTNYNIHTINNWETFFF